MGEDDEDALNDMKSIDYARWSPRAAPVWSIAMTVAWIANRRMPDVVDQWTTAVAGTERVENSGGGQKIVNTPAPSVVALENRPTGGALVFGPPYNQLFSIADAIEDLFERLGNGELHARARPAGKSGRVFIEAADWATLEVGATARGDALFFVNDPEPSFEEVELRSSEVLAIWKDRISDPEQLDASIHRRRRKNRRTIIRSQPTSENGPVEAGAALNPAEVAQLSSAPQPRDAPRTPGSRGAKKGQGLKPDGPLISAIFSLEKKLGRWQATQEVALKNSDGTGRNQAAIAHRLWRKVKDLDGNRVTDKK